MISVQLRLYYFAGTVMATFATLSYAQVNSWTNPASAAWHESFWDAGVLPGAGQSIFITNAGWKAVGIHPFTRDHYPGTLTVSNLTVSAPSNSWSTLLLNYIGHQEPLYVTGEAIVGSNGSLTLLSSIVRLTTNHSILVLGSFGATDSKVENIENVSVAGHAGLTNSLVRSRGFQAGEWNTPAHGSVWQKGGTNMTDYLYVGFEHDGDYTLENGELIAGRFGIGAFSVGRMAQLGGTVRCNTLEYITGKGSYDLRDGSLEAGEVLVNYGRFTQQGGSAVSGQLFVASGNLTPSIFEMSGGYLECTNALVSSQQTEAYFSQSGGTNLQGLFQVVGGYWIAHVYGYTWKPTTYSQSGGSFRADQVTFSGGSAAYMSGGSMICSNLEVSSASFVHQTIGHDLVCNRIYATNASFVTQGRVSADELTLSGGHFSADNAYVRSLVILGSSSVKFGGPVVFHSCSQLLWNPEATLRITGWDSTNGIRFGTSSEGLRPDQVAQILFVQSGYPETLLPAMMMADGRLLPHAGITAALSGTILSLTWPSNRPLQSADSAEGPYTDLAEPVPPYRVDTRGKPRQFFRMKPTSG